MSEEYGYQRSGKKCREKFENLYKYYKKTKEGKAGRQDGKHYRFFRQLEALFGENTNPSSVPESNNFGSTSLQFQTPSQTNQEASMFQCYKHCDSVSLTHTHSTELDLDASSSDVNDESLEKRRKRGRRNWKGKIKEFIDAEMKKVMEKQEAWLDRVTKTLEEKEKERVLREEEWSRQETARLEREHEFWAKERTWIETRDAALMEALQKLTGRHIKADPPPAENHINEDESEILHSTDKVGEVSWPESEVTTLVQIRAEMESRIGQNDCSEEVLWEEVATKMACFGYQKNASMCKDKWEDMRNYHKKRRENSRSCFYLEANDQSSSLYNQGSAYCDVNQQRQDGSSPSNSNVGNESCFPLLMCEGENLWENYGFKLNKANQNP